MAKKKKKNRKGGKGGASTSKTLGAGLLGGVATLAASQVIKSAVDEFVSEGARRVLGRRKAVNKPVEHDLGFVLLHLLSTCERPAPVSALCAKAKAGLVPVLDAVQSLRRGRLVTFTGRRRMIELTPLGRETLDALTATTDHDERADDAGEDSGGEDATTGETNDAASVGTGAESDSQ